MRFEDLVARPREEQSKICNFLNIPFDESILDPYEGERMITFPSDPNLTSRARIDPNLATAWQKNPPPQKLSKFTQKVAAELGYELD